MISQASQNNVDDIRLLLNFKLKDAIIKSSKDLNKINKIIKWTFRNKLRINPDKTKFVICGSRAKISKKLFGKGN